MIQVDQLQKRFGQVVAVDGASFVAADGVVTGLLGPNGAGKTTTLRIVSGLMKADSGRVVVDDVDVAARPLEAQARMGMLPEAFGLYPRLTPREHVRYFGRLQGLDGVELERRIDSLIGTLGLESVADRKTEGFSHGERTKVALARTLVHQPRNVLLDEPTNGLDVMSTRSVRDLIRQLRKQGCCVVFSSHIMQEVAALCDFIVIIAHGRVAAQGTPEELREKTGHSSLEDAFVSLVGLDETEEGANEAGL